jgi:zinc transport system permease protein
VNIGDFIELLSLAPVQRGLAALLISGASLPLVGVFIVGLNIYPLRFTIMHMALLAAALGQVFGVDSMLLALIFCALTGRALAFFAERPAGAPGAMGFFMVVSIALAFLALSLGGVHANAAFELLWGSVLAVRRQDLLLLALICSALPLLFFWKRRQLALLLYDQEIAWCSGVPTKSLTIALYMLIAVAIASAIRLTGALLADAVTILPALAARNVGGSLASIAVWALIFGFFGNVAGFFLAVFLDQPLGPVLVLTAGFITLLTYVVNAVKGACT